MAPLNQLDLKNLANLFKASHKNYRQIFQLSVKFQMAFKRKMETRCNNKFNQDKIHIPNKQLKTKKIPAQ